MRESAFSYDMGKHQHKISAKSTRQKANRSWRRQSKQNVGSHMNGKGSVIEVNSEGSTTKPKKKKKKPKGGMALIKSVVRNKQF
jgi:hypothetical protein